MSTYPFPADLAEEIKQCMTTGRYPSEDDLLREALRALKQRDEEVRSAQQGAAFEKMLLQIGAYARERKLFHPTCFISYASGSNIQSWANSHVEEWVNRFDEDLRKAGLSTLLDQRQNAQAVQGVQHLVDRIAACDRILVVGTPAYLGKYENRAGENGSVTAAAMNVIRDRMHGLEEQRASILPLLLAGNERFSLPPSLRNRAFADFREQDRYAETALHLIVSLYGIEPSDPVVENWREILMGPLPQRRMFKREPPIEEPDPSPEQLRAALPKIGEEARNAAFDAGQPVIQMKGGQPVWIYPDGAERPADPAP